MPIDIPIGNIKKLLVIYFTNVAIDDVREGYFTHCYKKAQLYTQFLVREDLYLHPIDENFLKTLILGSDHLIL